MPTSARQRASGGDVGPDAELADAQRALIARRLPLLAVGWLGLGVVLRVGLVTRADLGVVPAVASLASQLAVFVVAIGLCRRTSTRAYALPIALGACAALVVLGAGFFAWLGGSVEATVFSLLMIGIGSSAAFAWGVPPALALLGFTAVSGLVAAPWLRLRTDPIEVLLEIAIGAVVTVVIAEVAGRNFRRGFAHERARREAARRLAASYEAYRDLADNARDLIFTLDTRGRFTYVNDALARFFGVPAAVLTGRNVAHLVPVAVGNPDPQALFARVQSGEDLPPQVFRIDGEGRPRWLEGVFSAIHDADGNSTGVRGIARDVTERHAAEAALRDSLEELRRSEERLRRLARRQATIREDERKRLGFDLHDDVCQELVGVGILVESIRRRLRERQPEIDGDLERIGQYVAEVGEHLRQLARDLRPMALRDLGLAGSLHSLAETMTAAGTPVRAHVAGSVPRLAEEAEIGVYRIAQEALANAIRHADARTIDLTLAVTDGTLALEIADDGRGFAPTARRGTEALGLVGMEERALALGGRLELRSAPGKGTVVRLECPVARLAPASAA